MTITPAQIRRDAQYARREFELYEFAFRTLRGDGLAYLRTQSIAYRHAVMALQDLILPAVRQCCPTCVALCCRPHSPERMIYIAKTVGGFTLTDYLLARCDTLLPAPCYANIEQNLCPFWDNGCRLPLDRRSFLCLKFFCGDIEKELDLDQVQVRVAAIKSVLQNLSLKRLFL